MKHVINLTTAVTSDYYNQNQNYKRRSGGGSTYTASLSKFLALEKSKRSKPWISLEDPEFKISPAPPDFFMQMYEGLDLPSKYPSTTELDVNIYLDFFDHRCEIYGIGKNPSNLDSLLNEPNVRMPALSQAEIKFKDHWTITLAHTGSSGFLEKSQEFLKEISAMKGPRLEKFPFSLPNWNREIKDLKLS